MKVVTTLLPLAAVVAAVGGITWFMLTRDIALGPWLLALLLFAHGWVHLMFVFPRPEAATATADGLAYPFDMGRSWLITRAGLDAALARGLGIALIALVLGSSLLAALSTVGLLVPAGWWAGLVVASAVGSALLLTLFYSPALLLGYVIDVALLWLVLASVWSPAAAVGP